MGRRGKWAVFRPPPPSFVRDVVPADNTWHRERKHHSKVPRVVLIRHLSSRGNVHISKLAEYGFLIVVVHVCLSARTPFGYYVMRPCAEFPLCNVSWPFARCGNFVLYCDVSMLSCTVYVPMLSCTLTRQCGLVPFSRRCYLVPFTCCADGPPPI